MDHRHGLRHRIARAVRKAWTFWRRAKARTVTRQPGQESALRLSVEVFECSAPDPPKQGTSVLLNVFSAGLPGPFVLHGIVSKCDPSGGSVCVGRVPVPDTTWFERAFMRFMLRLERDVLCRDYWHANTEWLLAQLDKEREVSHRNLIFRALAERNDSDKITNAMLAELGKEEEQIATAAFSVSERADVDHERLRRVLRRRRDRVSPKSFLDQSVLATVVDLRQQGATCTPRAATYRGHRFEALKLRFENQVEQLYRMTMIDLRIFSGFITLQLAVGSWVATRAIGPGKRVGLAVIDSALATVAFALIHNNALRRKEVAAIVANCARALGYKDTGVYLGGQTLDVTMKMRLWRNYYYLGIFAALVGVLLVLSDSAAPSSSQAPYSAPPTSQSAGQPPGE